MCRWYFENRFTSGIAKAAPMYAIPVAVEPMTDV